MFRLYAEKNQLCVRQREPITSGSVNVYDVLFEFSADWDGLEKTAVFRAGGKAVSVLLDDTGRAAIPWEAMTTPGVRLEAGVYGVQGEEVVLPTIWADLGYIQTGAKPGENTFPPTPGLWLGIGHGLKVVDGDLTVDTVDDFKGDNTLPMTAAGVNVIVGNIDVLLGTI